MKTYKRYKAKAKSKYGKHKQTRYSTKRTVTRAYKRNTQVAKIGMRVGAGNVKQPFPPTLFTMLTYSVTKDITTSGDPANISAPLQIRMNSIYDPEVALGGGQPRYTDTLLGDNNGTAPYHRYRVHSSAIKCTIWKPGTNATDGRDLFYIIPARDSVTVPSSLNEVQVRPYSKTVPCASMYSGQPRVLKHYTKAKWHLSHKDLRDVDNTAGTYTANPNEQVYWNIGICDVAQTGAGIHLVTVQVQVIYYVEFYELTDVADS